SRSSAQAARERRLRLSRRKRLHDLRAPAIGLPCLRLPRDIPWADPQQTAGMDQVRDDVAGSLRFGTSAHDEDPVERRYFSSGALLSSQATVVPASQDEVEQSYQRPCRQFERQVQTDMRTHLIHRSARDIFPLLGGSQVLPRSWSASWG